MRYATQHKEKTHQRIVDAASEQFRTHGFDGIGIAKLMGALELTHGGFYAHFEDKEDLIGQASVAALNQSLEMMLAGLKSSGFAGLISYYLSEEQRDRPASACPLPALTGEVSRRPAASRQAFTEKLSAIFQIIAEQMPGRTPAHSLEKVMALFASLVGAMSLARAVSDPALSRTILHSTREHLLRFIEETEE